MPSFKMSWKILLSMCLFQVSCQTANPGKEASASDMVAVDYQKDFPIQAGNSLADVEAILQTQATDPRSGVYAFSWVRVEVDPQTGNGFISCLARGRTEAWCDIGFSRGKVINLWVCFGNKAFHADEYSRVFGSGERINK